MWSPGSQSPALLSLEKVYAKNNVPTKAHVILVCPW